MKDKMRVLVCVLCGTERQNWINPDLSLMLWRMSRDSRFDVEFATVKDATPVHVARNFTVKAAREHRFDYLVSLDCDNFMPMGTPLDVIARASCEHSVIGLAYALPTTTYQIPRTGEQNEKTDGVFLYPPLPSDAPGGAFQEVNFVAGGVLVINRKVWEHIPAGPWFRWPGEDAESQDRSRCGEELHFCDLVRRHGLRVFTHGELLAGHYRTVDLTGIVCTMAQMSAHVSTPPPDCGHTP